MTNYTLPLLILGCVLAPFASSQQAKAPEIDGPSLALALEAAQVAVSRCADDGYKVAVVVIDAAGGIKVTLRADGMSTRAIEFATRKANTSLKYGESSLVIQGKAESDNAFKETIAADATLIARGGALPLKRNGVVIGAIGVGGAPGGEKDDVCTKAAVEKIAGRL